MTESILKPLCDDHSHPALSIILPAKNEQDNIRPLYNEIVASLHDEQFEIIYVDDGSTDGTYTEMTALFHEDPRVTVLRLRKNYGKSASYMAGFGVARGDVVATMDSDMQDMPADLLTLREKLREGYDLAVGWKHSGKSSPVTFVLSKLFNGFIRMVIGVRLHDMNCPLRVMRREVAKSLSLYGGMFRYLPYIVVKEGFRVTEAPVTNRERRYGTTKYGGLKYIRSFFDFATVYFLLRFSEKPLHLFGGLGALSFCVGFTVDAILALRWAVLGVSVKTDLPMLLFGVLLILLGVQLACIGLLGELTLKTSLRTDKTILFSVKEKLTR